VVAPLAVFGAVGDFAGDSELDGDTVDDPLLDEVPDVVVVGVVVVSVTSKGPATNGRKFNSAVLPTSPS
jgi:hypothetical protein